MRKCRNGLPVTIDREGQRLPRLRTQRPKRPRRECGVGRRESAKRSSAASAAVLPQGAAVCGDRGGLMKRGPRSACAVGHSSTFHRRKVDRKAAGGPLYQGRNAPRSPPFALSEDGFCYTPAPRLPRGFAFPCGGRKTKVTPRGLCPFLPGRFLTDLCQETVFIFPGRRASLY